MRLQRLMPEAWNRTRSGSSEGGGGLNIRKPLPAAIQQKEMWHQVFCAVATRFNVNFVKQLRCSSLAPDRCSGQQPSR